MILPYILYTHFVHCILEKLEDSMPEDSYDGNGFTIYFIFLIIQKHFLVTYLYANINGNKIFSQ